MRYEVAIFSRCLFCHAAINENETLEGMTRGERFAFDSAKGRLWVVCGECRRWNLVPIEDRWEALEALERIARDEARLLVETPNIALLRVGDVDLIRVGHAAHLPEEAWWRYGRFLASRDSRYYERIAIVKQIVRELKFGQTAWRGAATCPNCGSVLREIQFHNSKRVIVARGQDGAMELRYRCYRCHLDALHAGYRLTGVSAEHLLRRILAYRHWDRASEAAVRAAAGVIEEIGSPDQLAQRLALQRVYLGELPRPYALALEIAVNDITERKLLRLDLKELEARWLEEEELARIVDDELTFVPTVLRNLPRESRDRPVPHEAHEAALTTPKITRSP